MKKWLNNLIKWGIIYPLVFFLCFEASLRILGYSPFYYSHYTIESSPNNPYIGDDELGITLNPGKYSITLNDSIHFKTTHNLNGTRANGLNLNSTTDGNKTLLLGCSFAYGYGVNDDQTFASLLQKHFENRQFENLGVVGYGTVQSFIQLQQILQDSIPDQIILNFSSWHFMRNNLTTPFRTNLKIGYKNSSKQINSLMSSAQFPFVKTTDLKIQYCKWENIYFNWPGRETFASINWAQSNYESYHSNKEESLSLTVALIDSMYQLCKSKNIQFGVVCLDSNTETKELHKQLHQVPWIDVNFDFTDSKYTNLPFDSHPNSKGHQLISSKVIPFITQLEALEE